MYINKVQILGNLTRDPELKALPSGSKVCSFNLATNEKYKDKATGQYKEMVEYHNVICFGPMAENVATYMKKGSQIYVEGKLQTRSWDDTTSGVKRYKTEILAGSVQFGNKPGGSQASSSPASNGSAEGGENGIAYPGEDVQEEDIPF